MSPARRPVEVSLVLYRLRGLLLGTVTAEDDLDGSRSAAVAELEALVGEDVYAQALPEQPPARGLLVRAGIVPGGLRTGPHHEATGRLVAPPLQLLAFCEAAEPAPFRTLDQIQTAAFLCTEGARVGWPDLSAPAMALYRVAEPTPPEDMGDERHVFSTATLRCALYSLAAA